MQSPKGLPREVPTWWNEWFTSGLTGPSAGGRRTGLLIQPGTTPHVLPSKLVSATMKVLLRSVARMNDTVPRLEREGRRQQVDEKSRQLILAAFQLFALMNLLLLTATSDSGTDDSEGHNGKH